jgi:hypothetical protein
MVGAPWTTLSRRPANSLQFVYMHSVVTPNEVEASAQLVWVINALQYSIPSLVTADLEHGLKCRDIRKRELNL